MYSASYGLTTDTSLFLPFEAMILEVEEEPLAPSDTDRERSRKVTVPVACISMTHKENE